jgi:hypothetical protein
MKALAARPSPPATLATTLPATLSSVSAPSAVSLVSPPNAVPGAQTLPSGYVSTSAQWSAWQGPVQSLSAFQPTNTWVWNGEAWIGRWHDGDAY